MGGNNNILLKKIKNTGDLLSHQRCTIFFFFKFIYFIYLFIFGCAGSSVRARAFSSCGKRGPLSIAVRGPFTIAAPPVAGHRLQTRRLSSCGSRAQPLRGTWDPPRPGLEPVSPALAGRLSTTAPPGKPKDAQSSKQSYSIILKVKKHLPSGQIWFLVMYLTLKATFFSPPKSPLQFNIFASP